MPISPLNIGLLGVIWRDATYVNRSLPFWLRSASKIFSAVADAIAWVFQTQAISHHIHYLDDFLFFCRPNTGEGSQVKQAILNILGRLGVLVDSHKVEGPSSSLTFLGVLFNTVCYELRLPLDKLEWLRLMVDDWHAQPHHKQRELKSFLGHLSHAATVIRPGWTFLREFFSQLHIIQNPLHYIRLNMAARADIGWGKIFLQHLNEISFSPRPAPAWSVFTDASGSFAWGVL